MARSFTIGRNYRSPTNDQFRDTKNFSNRPVRIMRSERPGAKHSLRSLNTLYPERSSKKLKRMTHVFTKGVFRPVSTEGDSTSTAAATTATAGNLPEYRLVNKITAGSQRNPRPRHRSQAHNKPRPRTMSRSEDPIISEDEDPQQNHNTPVRGGTDDEDEIVVASAPQNPKTVSSGRVVARVVSGTLRHGKRQRYSPDQLGDGDEEYRPPKKIIRPTNFSDNVRNLANTDDIKATKSQRGSSDPGWAMSKFGPDKYDIVGAVSNRHVYSNEDKPGWLSLGMKEKLEEQIFPVDIGSGEEVLDVEWMRVDLSACLQFASCRNGSEYVMFKRRDSTQSLLMIRFKEKRMSHCIRDWVEVINEARGLGISLKDTPAKLLERTFANLKKQAEHHLGTQKNQSHSSDKPTDIGFLQRQTEKLQVHGGTLATLRVTERTSAQIDVSARSTSTLRDAMKADPKGSPTKPVPDRPTALYFSSTKKQAKASQRLSRRASSEVHEIDEPLSTVRKWTAIHGEELDGIWGSHPLTYERTQVDKSDISRLDEDEFLNDNVISFYLRYLQVEAEKTNKTLKKRVHILNTFFYPKLRPRNAKCGINYEGVKSWTSKIDISSFDYIVVPVNESFHWYLAIICNTPSLLRCGRSSSDQHVVIPKPLPENAQHDNGSPSVEPGQAALHVEARDSTTSDDLAAKVEYISLSEKTVSLVAADSETPNCEAEVVLVDLPSGKEQGEQAAKFQETPNAGESVFKILTLDSLNSPHSRTVTHLRDYIVREIEDKRGLTIEVPARIGMTASVPSQENYSDCGVYLLAYTDKFLSDPEGFVASLLRKEKPRWEVNSTRFREDIRNTIISLREEQKHKEKEREKLKHKAKKRNTPKTSKVASKNSSRSPVSATASSTPTQVQAADIASKHEVNRDIDVAAEGVASNPAQDTLSTTTAPQVENDPSLDSQAAAYGSTCSSFMEGLGEGANVTFNRINELVKNESAKAREVECPLQSIEGAEDVNRNSSSAPVNASASYDDDISEHPVDTTGLVKPINTRTRGVSRPPTQAIPKSSMENNISSRDETPETMVVDRIPSTNLKIELPGRTPDETQSVYFTRRASEKTSGSLTNEVMRTGKAPDPGHPNNQDRPRPQHFSLQGGRTPWPKAKIVLESQTINEGSHATVDFSLVIDKTSLTTKSMEGAPGSNQSGISILGKPSKINSNVIDLVSNDSTPKRSSSCHLDKNTENCDTANAPLAKRRHAHPGSGGSPQKKLKSQGSPDTPISVADEHSD